MFEFDWSVLQNLPLTFKKFKEFFHISMYDSYLNKFWFKNDYHESRAIDFSEINDLIDQIKTIILSEEATFDFSKNNQKVYRHIITTSDTVITTPFFNNKEDLYIYSIGLILPEIEKELAKDEFRGIITA